MYRRSRHARGISRRVQELQRCVTWSHRFQKYSWCASTDHLSVLTRFRRVVARHCCNPNVIRFPLYRSAFSESLLYHCYHHRSFVSLDFGSARKLCHSDDLFQMFYIQSSISSTDIPQRRKNPRSGIRRGGEFATVIKDT